MTLMLQIAWRNLWRNGRRTLLSVGSIAFLTFLIVALMALQVGTFDQMIEYATGQLQGHLQIQQADYRQEPTIDHSIASSARLAERLRAQPEVVVVGQRATGFMVVSGEETSEVAQLYAVEPQRERALSTLPDDVSEGRYLTAEDETGAVLGWKLAENLGVGLGDDVVLMGTSADHGAVFFLVNVVGLLDVAADPLDETLMLIPLRLYQQEMGLEGRSHQIVVKVQDIKDAPRLAETFARRFLEGTDDVALSWRQLIPDVVDMMQFKLNSMFAVFGLLALMVSLSIGNTFMMTIFERTPEFGMLMAVGLRPRFIIGMLQVEALVMCVIGLLLGFVLAGVVVLAGKDGIPVNNEMAEIMAQFAGPDRLIPELQPWMLLVPAVFMVTATQLASLIPGLRLRHLQPVEALAEEV